MPDPLLDPIWDFGPGPPDLGLDLDSTDQPSPVHITDGGRNTRQADRTGRQPPPAAIAANQTALVRTDSSKRSAPRRQRRRRSGTPLRPTAPPAAAPDIPPGGTSFTVNLSSVTLTPSEQALLDRGLTFVPTYETYPVRDIYALQDRYVRSLKLKDYYANKKGRCAPGDHDDGDETDSGEEEWDPDQPTFTAKSTWTPPDRLISADTLDIVQSVVMATERLLDDRPRSDCGELVGLTHSTPDNLSPSERATLARLSRDPRLVIKPADKGGATVVMDRSAYLAEGYRQLNNPLYYRRLERPIYTEQVTKINELLEQLAAGGWIDDKQLDFLSASPSDRPRRFYLLPKIHKPREKWPQPDRMPEGRPIVSDCGSESYRVAQYIDHVLRPISCVHRSYLKDTYDFLDKVRGQRVPADAILVTGDVTALYTNMRHDRIMRVVSDALCARDIADRPSPNEHVLALLDLTLRTNDFEFDGSTFLQTCGTAMGKAYAPNLANLYLVEFDEAACAYPITPRLYHRFIDDVQFVWTGTEDQLKEFGTYLNSLIEGITVTLNWSGESVNFLDTTLYKDWSSADPTDGSVRLATRVYFKETDTHQLLHADSFHPRHTFRGVLKSQFLRFKRISSSRPDFDAACRILISSLRARGYSGRLMRAIRCKVWNTPLPPIWRSKREKRKHDRSPALLPVVVPYNSLGIALGREWRRHLIDDRLFSTFKLVTAYTVGPSLCRQLVRSVLGPDTWVDAGRRAASPFRPPPPPPINTTGQPQPMSHHHRRLLHGPHQTRTPTPARADHGCRQCSSTKCRVCSMVRPGTHVVSCHNGRRFRVRGTITCRTVNLVYLIECVKCRVQYVGETSRSLADRLNDHLSSIRRELPTPVALHFSQRGHSARRHLRITGLETFVRAVPTAVRRMRERNWQDLLQSSFPLGINHLKPSLLPSPPLPSPLSPSPSPSSSL
jgi:hypothetical protein